MSLRLACCSAACAPAGSVALTGLLSPRPVPYFPSAQQVQTDSNHLLRKKIILKHCAWDYVGVLFALPGPPHPPVSPGEAGRQASFSGEEAEAGEACPFWVSGNSCWAVSCRQAGPTFPRPPARGSCFPSYFGPKLPWQLGRRPAGPLGQSRRLPSYWAASQPPCWRSAGGHCGWHVCMSSCLHVFGGICIRLVARVVMVPVRGLRRPSCVSWGRRPCPVKAPASTEAQGRQHAACGWHPWHLSTQAVPLPLCVARI